MKTAAFEVRGLRKTYATPQGPLLANDGITFSVLPGEAFGLLGANGAGKTTLVRQLVGLLVPSSGEVRLFGEVVRPGERRIARMVAYLPQGSTSLGELKVQEALVWTGMLRGAGKATAERQAADLCDVLDLGPLRERQLRRLSGGQRRLVQIGMTLVGEMPVLILDEPTTDVDPRLRRRIWELVSARAEAGASVILVTHDVAEAEHALTRVGILDAGRLVVAGTPAELKADLAHRTRIEITVAESATVAPREVAAHLAHDAIVRERHISSWVAAEDALATLEKVIASSGPEALEDVRLITPTLEDVYLEVAGRSVDEAEAS